MSDVPAGCSEESRWREKSYWWDSGIVYITPTHAKLALLKFEKNEVQSCAASIDLDFFEGTGFAFVGSKLYAFGRRHHDDSEGLDFFVCDLKDSRKRGLSGLRKSYEFKQAGMLMGPKSRPIVIPYHDKIYIIPTGVSDYDRNSFAEVLRLPSHESHVLKTPFDEVYTSGSTLFVGTTGFTVSGKYAFMHIYSGLWHSSVRLFCLNMDTEKWIPCCFESNCSSLRNRYVSNKDASCSSCYEFNSDPYCLRFQNAVGRLFTALHKICQEDKVFVVKTKAVDGSGYTREFRVLVLNIMAQDSCAQPVKHPLESLQNLLNEQIGDAHSFRRAWAHPLGVGSNCFCLYVWYTVFGDENDHMKGTRHHLFTCNFELVDKSLPEDDSAMDTGDSTAASASALGRKSRYDCVNLSHALFKDIFETSRASACLQYAFTPVSTNTFPLE